MPTKSVRARVAMLFSCLLFLNSAAVARADATTHLRQTPASPHAIEAEIKVISLAPPRVRVEGRRAAASTAWSFRKTYASVSGLGERIENFSLRDEAGAEIPVRQLIPGEYESARPATRFAYDLKLDPPPGFSGATHVSWLADERGLLMTGDLLPLRTGRAKLHVTLPGGWASVSGERKGKGNDFEIEDAETAVIVCGRGLRERRGRSEGIPFIVATTGEWAFGDDEVAEVVGDILKTNVSLIGIKPKGEIMVALVPPPRPAAATQWAAETRGSTVTLVSGQLPSKLVALAQLNGALSHELFHVWVPNSLSLSGDYAWFYEGFTNYQAVLVGMRRGQLTFRDYLNALGRAYDDYRAARGNTEIPLIAASRDRWADNRSLVYHKGMLVAFLYDLSLSLRTSGRESLPDVFRKLFRQHAGSTTPLDGNDAVVSALKAAAGMDTFVESYVVGNSPIDLRRDLAPFGLKVEPGGVRTHVAVANELTREQRDLLKKFSYNEKLEAESRRLHQRLRDRKP
jgi:hypothetical protein